MHVASGMLLATINSGTLIIALPDLERALGHQPPHARLGDPRLHDRLHRARAHARGGCPTSSAARRPTSAASSSSRLASLGAGFAADGTRAHRLARSLQGVGAAFLFANSAALVTDAFPREQLGLAMGTNTMVAAVGLVIGPVLGGALILLSWHWVFWFNVPFGLARRALGLARSCTSWPSPTACAASTSSARSPFVIGLTGLVFGDLPRRPRRLERPARHRRARRRRRAAAALRARSRAGAARRCSTSTIFRNRLFATATGGRVPQRPVALRAACSSSSSTTRARRATTRSRRASSSPRSRSGCSSPRRWPASPPTGAARGRSLRSGCSSPRSAWPA